MPRATDELGRFKCSTCKRWLPRDDFHRHTGHYGGKSYQCKECRNAEKRNTPPQNRIPRHLDTKQFIKNWKNHSKRELSAIYGVTETTIEHWAIWLRKIGWDVPYKRKRLQKFDRDEFVRFANSMPISDVADKLGMSYKAIVARITKCRKEGYNV